MRVTRARATLFVLLGLCVLAAVGVAVALAVSSGSGGKLLTLPTTGAYAPMRDPKLAQRPSVVNGVLTGDLGTSGLGGDLQTVVGAGSSPNQYKLTVTNTSSIGGVDSFQWFPSPGVRILKVVGTSAGRCRLTGTTGFGGSQFQSVLLYPNIKCEDMHLKAPTCTCRADGGTVVITFVATGNEGLYPGTSRVESMTPQLKLIPSYPQQEDAAPCAPGQVSTPAKPCASP